MNSPPGSIFIAMYGSIAITVRIDHKTTFESGRSPLILTPAPTFRFSTADVIIGGRIAEPLKAGGHAITVLERLCVNELVASNLRKARLGRTSRL